MKRCNGHCALFILIIFMASCSRDPFEEQIRNHPRRFELNGKGYILSEQEPGRIEDDLALYTADAGARTFKYGERMLLTQLYVGRWEAFDSLTPAERKETVDLAKAALTFIGRLERRHRNLSEIDRQHREILSAFLENRSDKGTSPPPSAGKQILEIPSWGRPVPSLLIEVPAGFTLSERKGPDFSVYSLSSKSANWGAFMGIYIGHNPSYPWPESASKQPGKAGLFPIVWRECKEGQSPVSQDS